jgi:hypothetical protein
MSEEKPKTEEEAPEVIAHSDEEEQPIITGDCDDFKGGCVTW